MEPTELADRGHVEDAPTEADPDVDMVEEELLIEEISIDGMCGVY